MQKERKTDVTATSGSDCAALNRCKMTVIGHIKLLTWNIFTVFPRQKHTPPKPPWGQASQ